MTHELSTRGILQQEKIGTRRSRLAAPRPTSGIVRRWVYLYNIADYDWCLDWKQMTRCCETPTGSREWTKEEMMAYLDWDKSENDRLDVKVADDSGRTFLEQTRARGDMESI